MNKIRYFLFTFLLCGFVHLSYAQDKSLQFIYVTKDYSTEVSPLLETLKDIERSAVNDKSTAVVFYMPNSYSPRVVRINLPGDNRNDIDLLYADLVTKTETIVNPSVDVKHILELFDEIELVDTDYNPMFSFVEFMFYVTPTFWSLQYNEQVIAATYFSLDADASWAKDYISFSLFHNEYDGIEYDEQYPFGPKNICPGLNFFLMTY